VLLKKTEFQPFLHIIIFYSDMKTNEYFYIGVFQLNLKELEFLNTIEPANFN